MKKVFMAVILVDLGFLFAQPDLGASVKPIRDDWVVVFSADKRYWWLGSRRVRAVRPDPTGRYTFRALPAGTYAVTLVPDPIPGDGLTAARLQALVSAGIRVTVAEGERKEQNFRKVK
ncbi:MAG TPA: hypothetical protein VES67_06730 [Vicinamibacterales bacterium]|nr:hypothetical protein [Vicinamibacterales bacterium]